MQRVLPVVGLVIGLAGCAGSEADVSGKVDGYSLGTPGTVMFGGPFVLIVDGTLDCLDVAWAARYYETGVAPADFDFQAIQFIFDDPEVKRGQFDVAGESEVSSRFLVQTDGAFTQYRAHGGQLIVDAVEDGWVDGSFDVTFDEGELSGTYVAEYCRNLKDN